MQKIIHEKYESYTDKIPFTIEKGVDASQHNFATELNWHENLEIEFITEGEGTVLINGEKYEVKKGDIIVINSNALHSTFTDRHLLYDDIIINDGWCRQMNMSYETLDFCSLIRSENLINLIYSLEHISLNFDDTLRTAKSNHIILQIMIELIENHSKQRNNALLCGKHFNILTTVIDYIYKNYSQKISLTGIAQKVLFDKYTLCKEFKKYTGCTIFEYINHYRCLKAVEFLLEGNSVNKTAEMCGFENLSYFNRTFKKYIGKTPSEYKANAQA